MFGKCFKYNQTGVDNLKSECKTKDITEELVLTGLKPNGKTKREIMKKKKSLIKK